MFPLATPGTPLCWTLCAWSTSPYVPIPGGPVLITSKQPCIIHDPQSGLNNSCTVSRYGLSSPSPCQLLVHASCSIRPPKNATKRQQKIGHATARLHTCVLVPHAHLLCTQQMCAGMQRQLSVPTAQTQKNTKYQCYLCRIRPNHAGAQVGGGKRNTQAGGLACPALSTKKA